jgi:adenosine kinase
LLESKTGLTDADVLRMVDVRVCTLGSKGVEISGRDLETVIVPAAREYGKADPTGVGDGFRAGFLAARGWGLSWERSAQVGGLLATLVLETVGTQEYEVEPAEFVKRIAESFGDEAATEIAPHIA